MVKSNTDKKKPALFSYNLINLIQIECLGSHNKCKKGGET